MKKLYIILFFGFYGGLFAQDNLLTKEAAISIALENNFGIKIAKNQVEVADNNRSILNSGYLPSLTGVAGANYNELNSNTGYPGQFEADGVTSRADLEINHAESQTYNAGLNLNYTLFDGLGRFYTYKQLKEQYQLTELQARETIENTIVQLFSVYYQVAQLTENANVLKQALEISKDRYIRAEYSFEYGQNTKLDILNAQVDVTNDSISFLNVQQQLVNAKRDLNVVLNQDLNKAYQVDTLVVFTPSIELTDHMALAKQNNVSLLQAEKNLKINEYDIKVGKSGYLPALGLTGSYGWNLNQSAASSFIPGQVIPGSNRDSYNLGLGASLTWNLFDGGSTAVTVKNAKIAYKNQEIVKQQLGVEVERDIQNAKTIYENLLKIYQIQEQNVITNENNFARSKEQFQMGRITSIEFRQAQINLLNAETNKNLAKYDAKLSELQLLQLTGQLLNVNL
ncbi:outer membrane efflux protein [Cellulophaga algicola DSM 14237]|uniref:Outer membrane efflux protein n=1 Tax=Cellulophaga algicola (strain DSM 14237 / IC166 / ACAM 630) TaxID=688270 RepID=E6X3P6_CELAD|nr:TolC family protein [Cellulophaga algicola]ADV48199.1 outer membrane efflux protein [Cellulophaga algicola DSM 14237]